ncbi:MAG TPA: UDP-N-acetylmuramoyl-L-alanyl-D-glutamate--2,6-diaminopimelate ligase, partial [Pirellulales bacterium]|nr:UDP-N-acetylmuramoyl-L-alanyl-D-glutamate--2,6-diaminopimelate ligase [Pirellulales bacterium]
MLEPLSATIAVNLREVLAAAEFIGQRDVQVASCSSDSRTCRPGDVFVALRGSNFDGHDFVDEALARGAVAIVTERPLGIEAATIVVADTHEALGQICQALANRPSSSLKVIGVTGTNGKTTTTHLISSILQAAGYRAGTLGTLGYCDTVNSQPARWTTPPPAVLSTWLARMVKHGCTHAVMEVSSHSIAQRRIAGVHFAHVCLTNLGRDHLDYHRTVADYHHAKIQLFDALASGGAATINVDDPGSLEHAPLLPGRVLSIAIEGHADLTAALIERLKSEQTFLLTAGNVSLPVRTAMIGDHHIYNCLMAAAVGVAEGIDLTTIVRGLESIGHLPGRLERIECGQPFGVFVDFAHTSQALEASLETLREVTSGRLICVFGAGGNRDVQKRPLMGQVVESLSDVAIVTSDNPRLEDPRAIAADVLAGF